ncbi:NmrA family NAD(P)-binding protein [Polaromonas sp. LjRoot131]|uniref:NmrA family NAD(P)-binding protein n=1 Tax=Polaromonas sp. LjRoot131 TaxID=3342262 RepID=UPI003ECEBC18
MHIILGGTGHVGSALVKRLVDAGEPVTLVTHDPDKSGRAGKAKHEVPQRAKVALADVHDVPALRKVFQQGTRLFLLNPPAAPATDTDAEERATAKSIIEALQGTRLEKIVAESTYGAQPVERAGDLGILYDMEKALEAQAIPFSVIRAAYYMSNWDASLKTARDEGVIDSMYPADFKLPMVAPQDLGEFAARLMTEPAEKTGIFYAEGPEQYSPGDVAAAFSEALGKPVSVRVTPREQWVATFQALGFSPAAAKSYAEMTRLTRDRPYTADAPVRGRTTLRAYMQALVDRQGA